MGGEIRTDGKRVTRKDMLKQIEYDHAELEDILSEHYQERGGIEAAKHVYKYCNVPGKEGPVGAWYSCFVLDPVLDLTIDSYKWALRYVCRVSLLATPCLSFALTFVSIECTR